MPGGGVVLLNARKVLERQMKAEGDEAAVHPRFSAVCGLHRPAAQGRAVQAVVPPTRDELFTASKGAGAFLNNRRIRVTAP